MSKVEPLLEAGVNNYINGVEITIAQKKGFNDYVSLALSLPNMDVPQNILTMRDNLQ